MASLAEQERQDQESPASVRTAIQAEQEAGDQAFLAPARTVIRAVPTRRERRLRSALRVEMARAREASDRLGNRVEVQRQIRISSFVPRTRGSKEAERQMG